jgi:ABC-type nitrate/sulfonate/bicarbonate transport system substrate-binding protein
MPALITSERLIKDEPDVCAAAVRALVKTQKALKEDVSLATEVGRKRFPAEEAELIAGIIQRDLPFYNAAITPEFVAGMSKFSQAMGLIDAPIAFEDAVATQFSHLWA